MITIQYTTKDIETHNTMSEALQSAVTHMKQCTIWACGQLHIEFATNNDNQLEAKIYHGDPNWIRERIKQC